MRKLTACLVAALLSASPAWAQMGGGGMGGGGGGPSGPSEVENEPGPTNGIGANDRPHEMKPISRETFAKAVTAMFAQADTDRDGMVTLAELQAVIDARREQIIRARFREIDANHDGHIDIDEFVAWQHRMGSAAASDCSVYTGHLELVPETVGPVLGDSERDRALALVIEPLSATLITKANVHYNRGATLADVLAYENARFDAADTNHDTFLVQPEVDALRHGPGRRGPGGAPGGGPGGGPGPGASRDRPLDN